MGTARRFPRLQKHTYTCAENDRGKNETYIGTTFSSVKKKDTELEEIGEPGRGNAKESYPNMFLCEGKPLRGLGKEKKSFGSVTKGKRRRSGRPMVKTTRGREIGSFVW